MFLQLPDNFTDAYMDKFGIPPPPDVFTHCRQEFCRAVIKLILNGSLQRHTSMVSSLHFLMGLLDGSSPGFTATQPITQKSVGVPLYSG